MRSIFIAAIIACVSTACVSGANTRLDTLERQNAELAEQNRRLRLEFAKSEQARKDPAETGEAKVAQAPQGSTGTMWARQKHGTYMGAVGEQPRQVTQGRKIKVTNMICDDNGRSGGKCLDNDGNGEDDYNTWLSFEIDGQPVVCDSGVFHPVMQVSMLLPQQSCFIEIGAVRNVKVKVREYRNNGNPWSYIELDTTPYATFYLPMKVGNGIATAVIDETFD